MQPQGHVQMMVNTLDYAMDPQSSLGAPRWWWGQERSIKLEPGRGDHSRMAGGAWPCGGDRRGCQLGGARPVYIWRLSDETGGYIAGSEPRADGQAAGY